MTLFTKLIRDKMKRKGDSYERLARALKCSEGFAKHLTANDTVYVSPRLVAGLAKRYRVGHERLESLASRRNQVHKRYVKARQQKHAS